MPIQNAMFVRIPTINFEQIRETEERIRRAEKSPNTRKAYENGWKLFLAWCAAADRNGLPAEPRTVQDYATWSIARGHRLETVFVRMSAITHYHREAGLDTPCNESVRLYLANARRDLREEPGGKAALSYDLLRKIAPRFPDTPAGVRNKAMILLQFAAGWRRSEIVALRRSDVHFVPEGVALWQRSSKTDQTGKGRLVGIDRGKRALTCPVRALDAWLAVRGEWEGPLFVRMDPRGTPTRSALASRAEALHNALKRVLESAGENSRRFGSHSLRAGMITEAALHGASEAAIMQRTGHHSSAMVRRYIRPANLFEFNPLKGVL